jgi:hypothetical protein
MASTYTPIATSNAGGSQTITFSSIPQTYTDLKIVCSSSSADQNTCIRVGNGSVDTGTNYSRTVLYGDGTSAVSGRGSNAAFWVYNDGTALAAATVDIMNYSNTTTYKTSLTRSNPNAGITRVEAYVNLWRSTSAINIITIYTSGSNNFTAGTTFTLYGIKAA